MGAAEAWLQGGALLVLIVFASIVLRALYTDNKELRAENKSLYQESLNLLKKYQERDEEERKEWLRGSKGRQG